MGERIYTKEECEAELARSQADMIVWATFMKVMERGEFVMIDESKKESKFRIVKAKERKH